MENVVTNSRRTSGLRTLQVTLPSSDASFLRRQSRMMGWDVVTVRPKTEKPKVKMTEDEFRAKLAASSAQVAQGKYISMRDDESAEQFIQRMLCM